MFQIFLTNNFPFYPPSKYIRAINIWFFVSFKYDKIALFKHFLHSKYLKAINFPFSPPFPIVFYLIPWELEPVGAWSHGSSIPWEPEWAGMPRRGNFRESIHIYVNASDIGIYSQKKIFGAVVVLVQPQHSVFPWWNRVQQKIPPCLLHRQCFFSLCETHCARKCTRATRLMLCKHNNNQKKTLRAILTWL